MNEGERFDYGDKIAYQRACDAEGCDRGLLLAPARFCGRCGGSGYLVRWEPKVSLSDIPGEAK